MATTGDTTYWKLGNGPKGEMVVSQTDNCTTTGSACALTTTPVSAGVGSGLPSTLTLYWRMLPGGVDRVLLTDINPSTNSFSGSVPLKITW